MKLKEIKHDNLSLSLSLSLLTCARHLAVAQSAARLAAALQDLLHDDTDALLQCVQDVLVGVTVAEAAPEVGDGVPGHSELLIVN